MEKRIYYGVEAYKLAIYLVVMGDYDTIVSSIGNSIPTQYVLQSHMKKDIQKMMHDTAKWIHGNQSTFLAFVSILVIAEVFAFPISSDVRLFGALFLYWFLARIGKLTSARVFQLCIILLIGMVLGYLTRGAVATTERLAVWFVLFFALGIFTQWREIST